jgi:hypothetical protein
MKPIDFPQSNFLWKYDAGYDLRAFNEYTFNAEGKKVVSSTTSKWELNEQEKAFIVKHGFIYITILGHQPPISPVAQPLFDEEMPTAELAPEVIAEIESNLLLGSYELFGAEEVFIKIPAGQHAGVYKFTLRTDFTPSEAIMGFIGYAMRPGGILEEKDVKSVIADFANFCDAQGFANTRPGFQDKIKPVPGTAVTDEYERFKEQFSEK